LLGRVNAAYRMVAQGIIPIGAAFGGIVAQLWGARAPFVVATFVFIAMGLAGRRMLSPLSASGLVEDARDPVG